MGDAVEDKIPIYVTVCGGLPELVGVRHQQAVCTATNEVAGNTLCPPMP